jgi:hypothetical protein
MNPLASLSSPLGSLSSPLENGLVGGLSRRTMLSQTGWGVGAAALAHLLQSDHIRANDTTAGATPIGKAKRVICLFQSGGPSHLELFDEKPLLRERFNQDLPDSVRQGQRITGMVSGQARLALQPSKFGFARGGECGTSISDLLPWTRDIADDICVVRSMVTDAINHDPAITYFQTGSQQPGRPSMGAWIDYGLGKLSENLPAFVVLVSVASDGKAGQGLLARLWGSGFLPGKHQGVKFRSAGEPVLYLDNPSDVPAELRRRELDALAKMNRVRRDSVGDPEIETRIAQYELAFRMQTSVPETMSLADETEETLALYGDDVHKPGTFARNCLLARRMAERGVRFVQLYHRDWDHHGDLTGRMPQIARDVDRPSAALVQDLKRRGLLDETIVIWGGEFGRTPYAQGEAQTENYGRDHHGRAFSVWIAGGGFRPGHVHGQTDEFGFNVVEGQVRIPDLQATLLHCLGIDHERLVFRHQGLDFRLTGVEPCQVVSGILK